MKLSYYAMLLVLVMIFTSCVQQETKFVCADGSVKSSSFDCSNNNNIDYNKNIVPCSTQAECPDGLCDMSSKDPSNWKCKSGQAPDSYCGDTVCDSLTENYANCPRDCKQ
jgi:hypothetical protein